MGLSASFAEARQWVPFTATVAVAAHAVMESTGVALVNGHPVIQCRQYQAGDPRKTLWVNGPQDVAANGYGSCTQAVGIPVYVKASGAIAAGDICGPTHSTWTLTADYPGFRAIAAAASDLVLAVQVAENTRCRGLLTANMATTDSTITVDNVRALCGLQPVVNTADTLTVYNIMEWEGDDDGVCLFEWHAGTDQWEFYQVKCPA